jgi:DNA-binding PadR family transcriptional regulator
MVQASRPRSPLSMVVLSLVSEEPMHPYRMQTLIKERGKDQIANVAQRNSVYQTIDGLLRAGLIAIRELSREERRPERTVYGITDEGRRTLQSWLRTVLAVPAREFPDFPAALSLCAPLGPDDVRAQLEARLRALEGRLAEHEKVVPGLLRIFLLESEYAAAVVRAEIKWLRAVIGDLHSGRLTWSEEEFRRFKAAWEARLVPGPDGVSPSASRSGLEEAPRATTARARPKASLQTKARDVPSRALPPSNAQSLRARGKVTTNGRARKTARRRSQ